jgi:hypothetical protein
MTSTEGSRKTGTVGENIAVFAALFLVLLVTASQQSVGAQIQSNKPSLYETYHWPALGLSIGLKQTVVLKLISSLSYNNSLRINKSQSVQNTT